MNILNLRDEAPKVVEVVEVRAMRKRVVKFEAMRVKDLMPYVEAKVAERFMNRENLLVFRA